MKLADINGTALLAARAGPATRVARLLDAAPGHGGSDYLGMLNNFVDGALRQCGAQSAGVSLFYRSDSSKLTWVRARGALQDFEGRRFPRRHSPCGVSLDTNATHLFIRPDRYFQWISQAGIHVAEVLITPITAPDGRQLGTMWMMTHSDGSHGFHQNDARALELASEQIGEAMSKCLHWGSQPRQAGFAHHAGPEHRLVLL